MALTSPDFVKGIDFTALSPVTAGDHNTLVDNAAPYVDSASEARSINIWTRDSAANIPIVPNPTTSGLFTKWKKYLWIRAPHSSVTDGETIVYVWNDALASSDPTYLKWQVPAFNTDALDADIAALDLRVADLEATSDATFDLVSAANSAAIRAEEKADAAVTTANAADANADQALAELDVLEPRVTSLEARVTTAESDIDVVQAQITTITNTLSVGSMVMLPPVPVHNAIGSGTWDTFAASTAGIPVGARLVMLQWYSTVNAASCTISVRSDAGANEYVLGIALSGGAPAVGAGGQGFCPLNALREFDYNITATGTSALNIIGYVL